MVMELWFIIITKNIKVNGQTIWNKVKEHLYLWMVHIIKDTLKTIFKMAKELLSFIINKEEFKEIGATIN